MAPTLHRLGPQSLITRCYHQSSLGKLMIGTRGARPVLLFSSRNCTIRAQTARKYAQQELSRPEINAILRQREFYALHNRDVVYSHETNQLAANSPCEDQHSAAFSMELGGWLFGIFDGHAGTQCSKAVSQYLYDYVALSLWQKRHLIRYGERLQEQIRQISSQELKDEEKHLQIVDFIHSSTGPINGQSHYYAWHLKNIGKFISDQLETRAKAKQNNLIFKGKHLMREAFSNAFTAFDTDLAESAMPDKRGNLDFQNISQVISGSCACVCHIDGPDLYIANVGDCSAMLGVCNERGSWTARKLTKDHVVDNVEEVQRISHLHPAKEASSILRNGRLLGELMPLRAFGDVRYKWNKELQDVVLQPLVQGPVTPPNYHTPPYLTAKPEVFYHRLTPQDKFLVIASDGLWEQLTPASVVRVLSNHVAGRQTLSSFKRTPDTTVGQILSDLQNRTGGGAKRSRPEDQNGATHLLRFALGGTDPDEHHQYLNFMLNLPDAIARNYRDDITITIVYFDTDFIASNFEV